MNNHEINLSDHCDLFTKAKGHNKYICPNCNGHNLAIDVNKNTGHCFNECGFKIFSYIKEELGLNQKTFKEKFTNKKKT